VANIDDEHGFRILAADDSESVEELEHRLGNLDGMSRKGEAGFLLALFGAVELVTAVIVWLTLR
jgi:hypothetical protein